MKDATPKDPGSPADSAVQNAPVQAHRYDVAVLDWSGVLTAGALILVPLWMLLSNSAVLGGHPALPALLMVAAAAGLLWAFVLVNRTTLLEGWPQRKQPGPSNHQPRRRSVSRWQLIRGLAGRLAVLVLVAGLAWLNPFPHQPSGADGQTTGTTTEDATSVTLVPEGKARAGLVFYPGARVDARAYQDILGPLANAGYLVVILKVPLGIPLLDISQARGAMNRAPRDHFLGSRRPFAGRSQRVLLREGESGRLRAFVVCFVPRGKHGGLDRSRGAVHLRLK